MCKIWNRSDVSFWISLDFWYSTSNLANKPIFKTLPFRRRRLDQKTVYHVFACASEDVVCKVWCRLVKKCGRSREKTVLRSSRFCGKKLWTQMGVAYAKRCSRLQCICVYKFLDSGRFGVGVIAPNAFSLVYRHLVAGVSGFCHLRRTQGPGSSHAIGVSAPFTVWAVVPVLGR